MPPTYTRIVIRNNQLEENRPPITARLALVINKRRTPIKGDAVALNIAKISVNHSNQINSVGLKRPLNTILKLFL